MLLNITAVDVFYYFKLKSREQGKGIGNMKHNPNASSGEKENKT